MEYSLSFNAGCAGSSFGHLLSRLHGLRGAWWSVRSCGFSDIARSLHVHALSNTRRHRRVVDGPERTLLPEITAAGNTVALGVLGICRHLCLERADKEPHRTRLSFRRNSAVPDPYQEPSPHSEIAADFQHYCVSGVRRAMAHPGSGPESHAGHRRRNRERILVVLFCQRTVPALYRKARPARLRHRSSADFLGAHYSLGG